MTKKEEFESLSASELFERALHDLECIEQNSEYQIEMQTYHQPTETACLVCMAGCILAVTFKMNIHHEVINPHKEFAIFYSEAIRIKLYAVDTFRRGNVGEAMMYLEGRVGPEYVNKAKILESKLTGTYVPYDEDPALFKAWARYTIKELKQMGL